MGVRDPKAVSYNGTTHEPKKEDVIEWRACLRKLHYLAPVVESNTSTFASMSGVELSDGLLNMTETGKERRQFHMKKRLGRIEDREEPPCPIFVTEVERCEYDDIGRRTVPQIKVIISDMLPKVSDEDVRLDLMDEWTTIKSKTKPSIVSYYNKLEELLKIQEQEQYVEPDDEEDNE